MASPLTPPPPTPTTATSTPLTAAANPEAPTAAASPSLERAAPPRPPLALLSPSEREAFSAAWDAHNEARASGEKSKKSTSKMLARIACAALERAASSLETLNALEIEFGLTPSPSLTKAKEALSKVHIYIPHLLLGDFHLRTSFKLLRVIVFTHGPFPLKKAKAMGPGVKIFLRDFSRQSYAA